MFSFFLLFIFIFAGYIAYRRGLRYQALHVVGFFLGLLLASIWYRPLAIFLTLWLPYPSASQQSRFAFFDRTSGLSLDKTFYAAFSFAMILMLVVLIWHLLILGFSKLQFVPLNPEIDKWAAILLSVIVTQISCFLFLFILATIPISAIQMTLKNSLLASALVRYSPGITPLFVYLFITAI